jgi:Holliday junction resolvase RusA-like endonuclease
LTRFWVAGIPAGQGRITSFMNPKTNKVVSKHSNADKLLPWRRTVADVGQQHAKLHDGPVALDLVFFLPRPKSAPKRWIAHTKRPDLSHLTRAVEDALTGVMYLDDSQVVCEYVAKVYAMDNRPVGVLVTVRPWTWDDEIRVVLSADEVVA